MAIEAGVPIIPICVSSYARHMDLRRWHSSRADIKFLPPISTKGLTDEDTNRILQQCWDAMKTTIDAMDRKIYCDA